MTTDKFCFYLQNRLIQTSQTGGQQYSDTPPFSIPGRSYDSVSVIFMLDVCRPNVFRQKGVQQKGVEPLF